MSTPSIVSAIKKLSTFLNRQEKLRWARIVGFAIGTSTLEVVTASTIVIFAQVLNQPEIGLKYLNILGLKEPLSPARIVLYMAMLCGIIYSIKSLWAAIEVFYQNFMIQEMNYRFKIKLLHQYAKGDYSLYLTRNSSYGVTVIGGDVERVFSGGVISLAAILSEGVVFTSLIGMIFLMNPRLALVILGIGAVLGYCISKGLLPFFYRWGQKLQESAMLGYQNLLQFFHAFKEILLLGKRDAFIDAFQIHTERTSKIQAIQTITNALPRIIIELMFVGIFVIAVSFMCLERESPQQMMGLLGGYLYLGFRLMPGLTRIIGQLNTFKTTIANIERVYEEYHNISAVESYQDIKSFTFDKSITIKQLSFQYPNTQKDALEKINLKINQGEYIGIVGETGSGKSTLVDVILGLLKPSKGEILVDDRFPVDCHQWHQLIGYVPQSIYLVDDTIEANIAFGEKLELIDVKRLNQAIGDAQLGNFIEGLQSGIKTIVGERGIRLSGGERQRIAIARALYRNPKVLVFDEATSALDNETESCLMDAINALCKNHTIIMVAHRLSTLKACNRILVMKAGQIESQVHYREMMENQQGIEMVT